MNSAISISLSSANYSFIYWLIQPNSLPINVVIHRMVPVIVETKHFEWVIIGTITLIAHIITIKLVTDFKHHQRDYSNLVVEMAALDRISFSSANFSLGSFCLDLMLVLFRNFDHSSRKNIKIRDTSTMFRSK